MLHDLKTLHPTLAGGQVRRRLSLASDLCAQLLLHKKRCPLFQSRSCGPRRFELPVTVGLLTVGADGELKAKIVPITVA